MNILNKQSRTKASLPVGLALRQGEVKLFLLKTRNEGQHPSNASVVEILLQLPLDDSSRSR